MDTPVARSLSLKRNMFGGEHLCPEDTKLRTVQDALDNLVHLSVISPLKIKIGDIKHCSTKVVQGIINKFSVQIGDSVCSFNILRFMSTTTINSADDLINNCPSIVQQSFKEKVQEQQKFGKASPINIDLVDNSYTDEIDEKTLEDIPEPPLGRENSKNTFLPFGLGGSPNKKNDQSHNLDSRADVEEEIDLDKLELEIPTLPGMCPGMHAEIKRVITKLQNNNVFKKFDLNQYKLASCTTQNKKPLRETITIKKDGNYVFFTVEDVNGEWKILNAKEKLEKYPELFEAGFDPSTHLRIRI